MMVFEEFEKIRTTSRRRKEVTVVVTPSTTNSFGTTLFRLNTTICLLLITLLLHETIGVAEALSSSSPKIKTQLLTSSSMSKLPSSLFPKTTTPTSANSSKNKPDDKKEKRSLTTTTTNNNSCNVEFYTNYWDNLLLEEYELASNEWKERRKRCSPQTLEKRGLAVLQAFAVPDSEILGEKTVRIHSGISTGSMDGIIMMSSDSSSEKNSTSSQGGRRRSSSYRSSNHRPWKEIFGKGDVLEMTSAATDAGGGFSSSTPLRKECLVIDVYDNNEMIVSVGKSWPYGLWEARKGSASDFGRTKDKNSQSSYGLPIRIDKTPNGAALVPLRSQRGALQKIRENKGGSISKWLASSTNDDNKKKRSRRWANQIPYHFRRKSLYHDEEKEEQRQLKSSLREATERVISRYSDSNNKRRRRCYLTPNESQKDAITYALSRRVSAIHGPPGTGKTRVAALLIATALENAKKIHDDNDGIESNNLADNQFPLFRVLGVAHSNGAADVLLAALLELGIPAVRYGRPTIVSSKVRHRTTIALAEKMPQVQALRKEKLMNNSNNNNIEWEIQRCIEDAQDILLETAPVVVTSCVGAYQLSVRLDALQEKYEQRISNSDDDDDVKKRKVDDSTPRFQLVVLDEAGQCTEPGLLCSTVGAKADQLVLVGDTKQLPPTVASSNKHLRNKLGVSPMDRLEKDGLLSSIYDNNNGDQQTSKGAISTLQIQYRMTPSLMEFPSNYFYNGLVKSPSFTSSSSSKSTALTNIPNVSGSVESPTAAAVISNPSQLPLGFKWPVPSLPLAFINIGNGNGEVIHNDDAVISSNSGGKSNPLEAKRIANIVINLLEASPEQQICILTPYSKQVQLLRSTLQQEALLLQRKRKQSTPTLSSSSTLSSILSSTLSSTLSTSSNNNIMKLINNIRVGTIDSFQGQECDIVLFSSVRSNTINELGFVRDPRRLCVALTRARKGLVVVGDAACLNSCRHWNSFIEYCTSKQCLINDNDDDDAHYRRDDNNQREGEEKVEITKILDKRISSLDDEFFGLFS